MDINRVAYRDMQIKEYSNYCQTYDGSFERCVGNWQAHEKYPYEKYLLEHYKGENFKALDFGCGIGRMIKRMLNVFSFVDGIDLMSQNLEYARKYIGTTDKTNLYQSDGLSCKIPNIVTDRYDFIYSTICLQHICVYDIRKSIIEDLFSLLKEDGQMCLQFGYGWNNNTYWFDNKYDANSTNAGSDVCIPETHHLSNIKLDFESIGFKKVDFEIKESPHPEIQNYHTNWLFIHLSK